MLQALCFIWNCETFWGQHTQETLVLARDDLKYISAFRWLRQETLIGSLLDASSGSAKSEAAWLKENHLGLKDLPYVFFFCGSSKSICRHSAAPTEKVVVVG